MTDTPVSQSYFSARSEGAQSEQGEAVPGGAAGICSPVKGRLRGPRGKDYVSRQAARRTARLPPGKGKGQRSLLGERAVFPSSCLIGFWGHCATYRSRLWNADGWRQPGVKQSP